MTASPDFISFVLDQMRGLAVIAPRRMFGGAGLFCDGLMFALIADDTLYLKADDELRPRFEADGLPPFTYTTRDGRRSVMSYWRAPEAVLDDPEAMREWAGLALHAARRAAAKSPAKSSAKSPSERSAAKRLPASAPAAAKPPRKPR